MPVAGDSPLHASHGGRDYHFCSQSCLDRFVAEPQRYASAEPAVPPAVADPTAEYTCPMHPEIRQIGPGTCPKCGMALEPVIPELEEQENPELRDFSRRFWWTLPLTVIVTLHDVNQAALYADHLVLLAHGRLLATGEPEDVLTPDRLEQAYNIPVVVSRHPLYDTLMVTPVVKGGRRGDREEVVGSM